MSEPKKKKEDRIQNDLYNGNETQGAENRSKSSVDITERMCQEWKTNT